MSASKPRGPAPGAPDPRTAFALSPAYYTDPAILEREKERIFYRTWQMVGHCTELRRAGDFVTASVCDQNLFVVRDRHDELRAFYNVCQHRAHELLQGAGNKQAITCPYHAWTYELDGRLRKARGADKVPGFDPDTICLTPIRLEQLCGFLFVNLDPEAASLEALFPDVAAEILGYVPEIGTYKLARRHAEDVQANWKVAVENYNECYHCPVVHPTFSRGVIRPETSRIKPTGMSVRHYARGHSSDKTPYHIDERAPRAHEYGAWYLWPGFSVQIYPGGVVNTYRWMPKDVAHTVVHREWYFPSEELTPEQENIIELDRRTTFAEDLPVMHAVQRGLNSRGYRPGPLMVDPSGVATADSENSVHAIQQLVLAALEA